MNGKEFHLHIVAFDIPWPADYGGVIDIYHKVRLLAAAGVRIHLHCFRYGRRRPADHLLTLCEEVRYYERHTGLPAFFSLTPYIVRSRRSRQLERMLLLDGHPILCEGIHTCALVREPRLRRRLIFRPSNVEHEYYLGLFRQERHPLRRLFFLTEAWKLRWWERHLRHVRAIVPVSDHDLAWFRRRFPRVPATLIPSFTPYDEVEVVPGRGTFALFHGKLSVRDNEAAALFLVREVAPRTAMPLVIAGSAPSRRLRRAVAAARGVTLVAGPDDATMDRLLRDAHVHLLLTGVATGIKLKLLIALFRGRYLVVNKAMITSAGLEGCILPAGGAGEIARRLDELKERDFSDEEVARRRRCLPPDYYNSEKVRRMLELLQQLR